MKCPFRTIRKVRYLSYATKQNTSDYDETTEFAECLDTKCPYWGSIGSAAYNNNVYGSVMGCRRVEKEG